MDLAAISNLISKNSKKLMSNFNWDYISIKKDEYESIFIEVGVYNIENQIIDLNKSTKNSVQILDFDFKEFKSGDKIKKFGVFLDKTYFSNKELKKKEEFIKTQFVHTIADSDVNITNRCSYKPSNILRGGIDIMNIKDFKSIGTLGAIFKDNNNNYFGITCSHVLNKNENAQKGDKVLSSTAFINGPNDPNIDDYVIGNLSWFKRTKKIDFALIHINKKNKIVKGTYCYNLKNITTNFLSGDDVKICGRMSKCQTGKISSYYSIKRSKNKKSFFYENCIEIEPSIATNGDSGSLVVNSENQPIGILVSNDSFRNKSFFLKLDILKKPIPNVLINNKKQQITFNTFNYEKK